ncbi:4-hydroxy-3-methylbut-2-enyl diphosphate reductase [Frankia sp. Ag45/Mut15]|uniref:4-hydroxy-3-methylbut-2-enyl diphosphate reductase n=1 Tax=Frankia umida TaxID=573489 RepID=A0ABT0JT79_9ACTN|nr:4-hydroxy-3-methylbut-2-enyl diphosphate reductase [Frankia umida]MCK9874569.1 4-hydroxy-3-methylbut-2-enyl diphosphate reductase [Frankia umida]
MNTSASPGGDGTVAGEHPTPVAVPAVIPAQDTLSPSVPSRAPADPSRAPVLPFRTPAAGARRPTAAAAPTAATSTTTTQAVTNPAATTPAATSASATTPAAASAVAGTSGGASRTGRLVVATALRFEAMAAGRSGLPSDTIMIRTGMGPDRARQAARVVREARPDAVAIVGLSGGLAPGVKPGHIVVAQEVRSSDGTVTPCASAPLLAGDLRRLGFTVHVGPIITVPRVAHGSERTRLAATGAIAVDMESAPIAEGSGDVPFAAVRVIVDTMDEPLGRLDLVRRGVRGLLTMSRLGTPLAAWAAAVGRRTVLLAEPRAFCAGVERAIEVVERALDLHGAPVYVRKQIVHNSHVVADLAARGAVFVEELDEVPAGATVVFSAHGVAPAVWDQADGRELSVIDATCPLVEKVHAEARRFTARGDTVLLIGHAGHEEVDGTLGESPGRIQLVQSPAEVADLEVPDPERVTYLMQTTLALDEASEIVDALRERFPAIVGPGSADICYATSNRQNAVRKVAQEAQLVLVVGSANSANSVRLVEVSNRDGVSSHLVENVGDVRLSWLAGVETVGISAGASAPPALVEELTAALSGLGPTDVTVRSVGQESISFHLPKELRRAAGNSSPAPLSRPAASRATS